MKKYSIFTLTLVLAGMMCYAQPGVSVTNSANKSPEPTVNGIPYSQYQAQQLAKQKQADSKAALKLEAPALPTNGGKSTWESKPVDTKVVANQTVQPAQLVVTAKDLGTGQPSTVNVPGTGVSTNSKVVALTPTAATPITADLVPQVKSQPGQGGNANLVTTARTADEITPAVKPVEAKLPVVPMQEKPKGKE